MAEDTTKDPGTAPQESAAAPNTPPAEEKKDTAKLTEKQMDEITKSTAQRLAEQKKKKVRLYQVPKNSAEKPLPDVTVQINGHTFQIKRGVEVEVPESVYEVLEQAGMV